MSLTDLTKPTDVALNTDLYELTMAQAFLESGLANMQATFNVFFRENPFDGGYAIACGAGQIADLVENFKFDEQSIQYLESIQAPAGGKLFKPEFLDYLRNFRMNVDIWAIPEGELVFPREPMVKVVGPAIDCQLLETALLNLVNFQTLVATKSARVVQTAEGHSVADFGLRRAQGFDGGLTVARASYVGGANCTSNVLAGKVYNIPVFGTHAHSWVMAFPSELEAFRAFAKSSPKNCVLLVDTYDVKQGVAHAITVAKEMEAAGERLQAIRIDSGDLAKLSKYARAQFDAAGLDYVKISVSNDLDEYTIQSLLAQGAPIDSFGVGTKLATCDPQPSLGGVYKLSATRDAQDEPWVPTMKLSEMAYKRTIPGNQHILRYTDASGCPIGDLIVDDEYVNSDLSIAQDCLDPYMTYDFSGGVAHELLVKYVEGGHATDFDCSLEQAKRRAHDALMRLDPAHKRFLNPQVYPVGVELGLAQLREELGREERASSGKSLK